MSSFNGKTVLITGGASGIGKIMGKMVLDKGARLIIWDVDEENLKMTLEAFSRFSDKVHGMVADVAHLDQIRTWADEVIRKFGDIDILINNAGIVVGKYFHEHSPEEVRHTMTINSDAPMMIALAFLPGMLKKNIGHICNISSSAGLVSNPKMSVYCASKWALNGWSDSLRIEMNQLGKNIKVTTVTPYYIDTGMFKGVKSIIPIIKPENAARKIIRGIEKNRIFVSMPWSVNFVRFGQGIMPIRFFDWFIGNVMGVYHTMSGFTGRDGEMGR